MRARAAGVIALGSLLAASLLLPVTASADALGPGVHADPGSPAAKEYSIPFGGARGGSGTRLFGAGITPPLPPAGGAINRPPTAGAVPASSSAHRIARGRARRATARPRSRAPRGRRPTREHTASAATAPGPGGAIAWMLAMAAGVIALGGAGAAAIARAAGHRIWADHWA
jgi:hypothetical protein